MQCFTNISFRQANFTEETSLTDLAFRSKSFWGYSEAFMKSCKQELTLTSEYLKRSVHLVAERKGELVGFAALSGVHTKQDWELDFLFIEPKFIGLGLGKLLWEKIIRRAKNLGIKRLILASDPGAESFYLKMGAKRIGQRKSLARYIPLLEFHL